MAENKSNKESNLNSDRKSNSDRNVTESDRELAQTALVEFNKNNFTGAAHLLSKLEQSRPKDIKVLSNKAVLNYYINGLKTTEEFQNSLNDICKQCGISFENIKSSDEIEASVIRFNMCTVWFHLCQWSSARPLLESMYKCLESLEESISIGLCLLLVEVLFGLSLPGRALSVVANTEATFLPQPLPPQTSSTKQLHAEKDSRSPEKTTSKGDSRSGASNYDRSNILNSHTTNDSIGGSSEMRCSADQEILRVKLQLLRVRSLLQMRILRAAKKELKSFVSHAANSGNPLNLTLIMLKSQLEFLKGCYTKAIRVVNQCYNIPRPSLSYVPGLGVSYFNNMGVIHMGLKKPTLACQYFSSALKELETCEKKEETPKTQHLYCNTSGVGIQILYNLGVTLLYKNHPNEAFQFLVEVMRSYPNNSRLWLRLAECCVAAHKMKSQEKKLSYQTIYSETHQKIFLNPELMLHDKKFNEILKQGNANGPALTLEFASICLRNCLSLIPENVSPQLLTDEQEASGIIPEQYPCSPCSSMKGVQLIKMKLRCLACSAYVALCLNQYHTALEKSQLLLQQVTKYPQVDSSMKILGQMYAGEALSQLANTSEAIHYFDPNIVGELRFEEENPTRDLNQLAWNSWSESIAKKKLAYNRSVAYAIKGQYLKANSLLKEVIDMNNPDSKLPAQAFMLAVYLNIKLGNKEAIVPLLQKGSSSYYI